MSILHIKLFGGICVCRDNRQTEALPTQGIQEVMSYLLFLRHQFHSWKVLGVLSASWFTLSTIL